MQMPAFSQKLARLLSWVFLAMFALNFLTIWFAPPAWQNPWQPVLLLLLGLYFRWFGKRIGKAANPVQ